VSNDITAGGEFIAPVALSSADNNVTIYIPAGVTGTTSDGQPLSSITVTQMSEPPAPPPAGETIISTPYEFGPSGARFSSPITMTFTYDPTKLASGVPETSLVIAYYSVSKGQWVTLGGVVDTVNHTITVQVDHFTAFAVISVVTTTTPMTGTFMSHDGNASVTIPSGVLGYTASGSPLFAITVVPVSTPPSLPSDVKGLGLYYDFGPSGSTFNGPITITLTYNPSRLPAGADQSKLYIAWWDTSTGQWVSLPGVVDQINHTITASVTHFTIYSALVPVTSAGGLSPWAIVGIIVVGLIVIGLVIWMVIRRRHVV
jgi:ZU5 domain.